MKQYFLKAAGMAMVMAAVHATGFAQTDSSKEKTEKLGDQDELIIRKKGDKDTKITVEIKDGQVFINGKLSDEFDDDNVSVRKRMTRIYTGDNFAMIAPAESMSSPFRGSYSFNGDGYGSSYSNSKTAFLGVTSEKMDDGGVQIREITKASAAEKSGLKRGDIITKIDEASVSTPEELSKIIHKYKPEDKVTVTYKRDGKEQKAAAVLGKYKMNVTYSFSSPKLEHLGELDRLDAPRAMGWNNGRPRIGIKAQDTEDGKGVKVLDVDDESPADKAGVKEGDLITELDGKPVNTAEELANASRAAREKASFHVKLKRNDKTQDLEIKIPKKLKIADL